MKNKSRKNTGDKGKSYWFDVNEPMLAEIENFGRLGVKLTYVIDFFMCNPKTWHANVKKYPVIMERYYKGRSEGIKFVTSKLRELVEKGNVTAIIFWLKCNAGMVEAAKPVEDPNDTGKPAPVPKITTTDPIEAARVYQIVMMKD